MKTISFVLMMSMGDLKRRANPGGVALLITTFNWPEALAAVLLSVRNQTVLPDEILIADDGSYSATAALLTELSSQLQLTIRHVWQPNRGFRAARARNLAIKKTDCRYLIMIDGDCMIPPTFIENHLKLRKKQKMVSGGRYLVGQQHTDEILKSALGASVSFSEFKFWSVPLGSFIRDLRPSAWSQVRTCNFAVHRNEILSVGGFDESYQGWGFEDSDLVLKLLGHGISIRSGRLSVCVKHLHHPPSDRASVEQNTARLNTMIEKVTRSKTPASNGGHI